GVHTSPEGTQQSVARDGSPWSDKRNAESLLGTQIFLRLESVNHHAKFTSPAHERSQDLHLRPDLPPAEILANRSSWSPRDHPSLRRRCALTATSAWRSFHRPA